MKNILGIDIGSTTVKIAILDEDNNILFWDYKRHFADIQNTLKNMINDAYEKLGNIDVRAMITGSGGLSLSKCIKIPFVQEVVAVSKALKYYAPNTDVAIEIGGEDAKIIYFTNGVEQRMNGICAGGTGSFIDQMASLLKTDATTLNEYAKKAVSIYPIAARCGVFAKTDIQPLINEGASKENLAASIFQAVVTQTISGLACGKPIRGNVAFLGGPLHFLSELRQSFIRNLKLKDDEIIKPENSHLFAAIGAAFNADENGKFTLEQIKSKLDTKLNIQAETKRLKPLFNDKKDYDSFLTRHNEYEVKKKDLSTYSGNCFLGIDAGSTTTKIALAGEDGSLLYSFYSNNDGSPLETAIRGIKEIYKILPENAKIVRSCSTGYGEALIKAGLMLDEGEVETIAHYYAAKFFEPDVDCILDIGGQDMKYISIKDKSVDNVLLNEACSSGCGSFIETFAKSLDYSVQDFAKEALFAKEPIDLGTRCTVFMNSNVKQAQKEGASVNDISAGLAYSVIKNALFKIIKLTNPDDLGEKIVVQGGTFYNDAVLKAFEIISGRKVIRPDICGIMGAFGAALIARERYDGKKISTMLSIDSINNLTYENTMTRCGGCTNNCYLTITKFNNNRRFVSGNRCEKGEGKTHSTKEKVPNLFDYKLNRTFDYKEVDESSVIGYRGEIGIPRVLNMYENFPFWAVFFKSLKFKVKLSPVSTKKIYEMGIESIPSESECYPAKLVHGHISYLIQSGIKTIFYPCIPYERNETPDAENHFNCPIVTSYAENIKNNVEELEDDNIKFISPFIAFTNKRILKSCLIKEFSKGGSTGFDIPTREIIDAVDFAWDELINYKKDIQKEGEKVLKYIKEKNKRAIVLAGRPYHIDPEINHGIDKIITSYDIAVLTEDSISHLGKIQRPMLARDQWMYHSRLYLAAGFVSDKENIDLIQLNSFGCGLDAVTVDGVHDILAAANKTHTVLKIDEVNNLGAAKIRIRSLIATLKIRDRNNIKPIKADTSYKRVEFTKDMRENYTIVCPQMSPIHFNILEPAMKSEGYNIKPLEYKSDTIVDTGLKYVNNDACYPSLIVVGQIMEELNNANLNPDKTAVMITQTGGGCRATNYIGFIRRALKNAGYEQIPVISLNVSGIESNSGFKITPKLLEKALMGLIFGDIFMRVVYRMRPYELNKGQTDKLHKMWEDKCKKALSEKRLTKTKFNKMVCDIIHEFDNIPIDESLIKARVGIVGEILVKFLPSANNYLVELLEKEGAEAVMPDLCDFLLYCFYNNNFRASHLGTKKSTAAISNAGIKLIESYRKAASKALEESVHFDKMADIKDLADMAKDIVSIGNQTGEGWFLTGEMLELIHNEVLNIVCTQPFACLPNHIVGKGVIKKLRNTYPNSNIVAIDYDPGASEVNQLNRIKLMLANAHENKKEEVYI